MSENPSEDQEMHSVCEASNLLQKRIAPPSVAASVSARIRHAARRLGWSYSRTKNVWYREAKTIHSHEMDRVEEIAGLSKARDTLHEIDQYIERAESILAESDPSLARPFAAAMRAFFSALDSTGAGKPNGEDRHSSDAR